MSLRRRRSEEKPEKPRKKRVPYSWLGEENVKLLQQHFGSVRRGLKTLVGEWRQRLGPEERTLKIAYHALVSEAEKHESMPYRHAKEVIMRSVGCGEEEALKIFRDLMAGGWVDWDRAKRGWVRVRFRRVSPEVQAAASILPDWMLKA